MRDCHEGAWGEIPAQGSLFCFSCLFALLFFGEEEVAELALQCARTLLFTFYASLLWV
jgi:hypothetical protein